MKRKILSLALVLMIISFGSVLPAGALSYPDADTIILDVADLQRDSAEQPNYTTSGSGQNYSHWPALGNVSWSTNGAIGMLTGVYANFDFNASKTGTYEVVVAGYESSATATADISIDGTKVLSGKTISSTAGEHSLGTVVLEEGNRILTISIPTGRVNLYNIKVVYTGSIPNSYYDVVLDVADLQRASAEQPNYTTSGSGQNYTHWPALGNVSWSTNGAIAMLTGIYANFDFNVSKTGGYEIIVAGNESSAPATADISIDGTKVLSGKTISSTAGEHSLGTVVLEEGNRTLTISIPTGRVNLYNIKVVYTGSIPNSYYDVVLDVADLQRASAEQPNYTTSGSGQNYTTMAALGTVSWSTQGAIDMLTGIYANFDFNVSKVGVYEVVVAGYESSPTATADIYVEESKVLSGKPISNVAGEHSLGKITLEEGDDTLKIQIPTGRLRLWNIKLAYVGDITNDMFDVVVPAYSGTITNNGANGQTMAPDNNQGWIPTGAILGNGNTKTSATYTVNIVEEGYYDVLIPSGSRTENLHALIDLYDGSTALALGCVLAGTSSAADVNVNNVYTAYLTAGTHNLKMEFRANTAWAYGMKLAYQGAQKTEFVIEAASPARVKTLYTNNSIYGTNNVAWADAGNINVLSSEGMAEYDFYISNGGYYTITVAAASGENSLISVDVDTTNVANRTDYSGENSTFTDSATVIGAFDLARTYIPSGAHTLKLHDPSNASMIYDIKLSLDENQPTDEVVRLIKQNGLPLDSSVVSGSTVCAEIKTRMSDSDFMMILAHYSDNTDTKRMYSCTTAPVTTVVTDNGETVYRASLTLGESGGIVKAFLWSADGKYIPLAASVSFQLELPLE